MRKTLKMNIGAFMIVLMLSLPFATAESLKITDVQVKEVSDRYAIINWITDKVSSSEVKFGENLNLDSVKLNSKKVTNHTILLRGLNPETNYFFNVSSNDGSETAAEGGFNLNTTLLDTLPPFINAETPASTNKNAINIIGTTEPNAEIYIYVDGRPSGFQNVTSDDGTFAINNVLLVSGAAGAPNQEVAAHSIVISAVDPARNRNEISKTIMLDSAKPIIALDHPIPIRQPSLHASFHRLHASTALFLLQAAKHL